MKLQKASRRHTPIRLCLQGPSGSGKTIGALRLAAGLTEGNWEAIAVLDSEHGSAEWYAEMGPYNVLPIDAPYRPEAYAQAITHCEQAGIRVIILDSISPEWECLLTDKARLTGDSFANWGKVAPRHSAFLHRMLRSPAHIIATVRTRTDYVLTDRAGRSVPEKVSLKGIQRDGYEYEFATCFSLDMRHLATISKDRTQLFGDQAPFQLDEAVGTRIRQWCQVNATTSEEVSQQVDACRTVPDLVTLFHQYPMHQTVLRPVFERRKQQILHVNPVKPN